MRNGTTEQDDDGRRRSRRAVLRAGALVAATAATVPLTACNPFDRGPKRTAGPDPLVPLIGTALDLAARHEAAATAFPELGERLTPIAQAHRAHAAELARVTGTALPSGAPSAAGTAPAGDVRATLAALRAAEQQGRQGAATACAAVPAQRAALAGSIAAARATHAEVLR